MPQLRAPLIAPPLPCREVTRLPGIDTLVPVAGRTRRQARKTRTMTKAPLSNEPANRRRSPTSRWDRWLQVVLSGVIVYGAGLVIAGPVAGRLFDLFGFGMRDAGIATSGPAQDHVLLAYGVLGSVLIGWMTTLLLIARGPLRHRDRWAWTTLTAAFTLWFAIDTTFSIVVGAPTHALFNLGFLLAIAPPLLGIRPELAPWPASTPTPRDGDHRAAGQTHSVDL